MIGPGVGVHVYLAAGVTDMRRGIAGLSALAQTVLHENPASGAVFAFRGRKGDRLKLLHWDGHGFCLYYKGPGARSLCMAESDEWRRSSNVSPAVDVMGRH